MIGICNYLFSISDNHVIDDYVSPELHTQVGHLLMLNTEVENKNCFCIP